MSCRSNSLGLISNKHKNSDLISSQVTKDVLHSARKTGFSSCISFSYSGFVGFHGAEKSFAMESLFVPISHSCQFEIGVLVSDHPVNCCAGSMDMCVGPTHDLHVVDDRKVF